MSLTGALGGHDSELARLVTDTTTGRDRSVLVEGEPCIGKSSLVRKLCPRRPILAARCSGEPVTSWAERYPVASDQRFGYASPRPTLGTDVSTALGDNSALRNRTKQ
jgi:hypothetical protein